MEAEYLLKTLLYLNLNISKTKIGRNKFGLISSFLSKRQLSFRWFQMGNLHKNTQLMLDFLKGPFLVGHFSYYILMIFLMMLSVILLSMLMILFSTLDVIRHLVLGNNQNQLPNLNLTYETLWTGAESDLLISMLEKLNQFCSTRLIRLVLFM